MYWNSLNDVLRAEYGGKVYKLALSSGCSCPNRDGTLGTRGCIFCDGAGAFAEAGDIPAQLIAARTRVAAKAGPDARNIAYFQSFTNTYAPVERLRELAVSDIDGALMLGLEMTLEHLRRQGSVLSPESAQALEYLKSHRKG